jgi:hypothetical protein
MEGKNKHHDTAPVYGQQDLGFSFLPDVGDYRIILDETFVSGPRIIAQSSSSSVSSEIYFPNHREFPHYVVAWNCELSYGNAVSVLSAFRESQYSESLVISSFTSEAGSGPDLGALRAAALNERPEWISVRMLNGDEAFTWDNHQPGYRPKRKFSHDVFPEQSTSGLTTIELMKATMPGEDRATLDFIASGLDNVIQKFVFASQR